MCARAEETIQHLFTDCETVRHIKSYIHDVVFMHWSHSDLYKKGELKLCLTMQEKYIRGDYNFSLAL
jgi:hypothetical protein